jgi:hypothetical protein
VQFVAIVERRLMQWYVYIPALASGGSVPELDDVQAFANALVTAATSLSPGDVQISVHVARTTDTLLPTSPTDVEVRHNDGIWRTAQHKGWLRQRDGSWEPLISYPAHGVVWERVVHASCFRKAGLEGVLPFPRSTPVAGPSAPTVRDNGAASIA